MRIEKGHKEEANVVDKKRACEYQKRACLYHFPSMYGNTGSASPGVARDEERVGVGGESLDGGSPDAATGRDWKDRREPHGARMPGEPHGARVQRKAAGNPTELGRGESM